MKALTFAADSSGKMTEGDIPAAIADRGEDAREQLIEMVAEADESLMETFFAEGTLTQEQLVSGLRAATVAGPALPAGLHVGPARDRHSAAARRPGRLRAIAGGARLPRRRQGRRGDVGQGVRQRRPTWRSCGRPSPIRSPAASRCCASSRER